MDVAVDALLAFAHHDPDTASDLARAGAFLHAELMFIARTVSRPFLAVLNAFTRRR